MFCVCSSGLSLMSHAIHRRHLFIISSSIRPSLPVHTAHNPDLNLVLLCVVHSSERPRSICVHLYGSILFSPRQQPQQKLLTISNLTKAQTRRIMSSPHNNERTISRCYSTRSAYSYESSATFQSRRSTTSTRSAPSVRSTRRRAPRSYITEGDNQPSTAFLIPGINMKARCLQNDSAQGKVRIGGLRARANHKKSHTLATSSSSSFLIPGINCRASCLEDDSCSRGVERREAYRSRTTRTRRSIARL